MKDTIITARQKKTEAIIWLVCFVIANLLNIYSIIAYETKWSEVFTSIIYVFIFSCVLYLFVGAIRVLYHFVKKVISKKK